MISENETDACMIEAYDNMVFIPSSQITQHATCNIYLIKRLAFDRFRLHRSGRMEVCGYL